MPPFLSASKDYWNKCKLNPAFSGASLRSHVTVQVSSSVSLRSWRTPQTSRTESARRISLQTSFHKLLPHCYSASQVSCPSDKAGPCAQSYRPSIGPTTHNCHERRHQDYHGLHRQKKQCKKHLTKQSQRDMNFLCGGRPRLRLRFPDGIDKAHIFCYLEYQISYGA